jgi:hypothetical protein
VAGAGAAALARAPFRFGIYALVRQRGELFVGRLFLAEIAREDGGILAVPQFLGPGDERAVTGDFVVLDRLGGGNDADIEHGVVLDLAHEVAALLNDAVDGRAFRAARPLAVQCEHLLQPFDLSLGLPQVLP